MLGIFCGNHITTNEGYQKYIKKRMAIMAGVLVLGAVTLALALLAEFVWKLEVSERMLGFFAGAGTGLVVGAVILLVRDARLLGDEQRLRKMRIKTTDERNIQISTLATKIAVGVLLVAMYVTMLVLGFWYPLIVNILLALIAVFLAAYVVAYRLLSRRI